MSILPALCLGHTVLSMQDEKAVNYLLRLRKYFGNIDISDMLTIFYTSVKLFCATGLLFVDIITWKKWIRSTFNSVENYLSLNICDSCALGECRRLPLYTTYIPNCIKYWLSLNRMENERYPK